VNAEAFLIEKGRRFRKAAVLQNNRHSRHKKQKMLIYFSVNLKKLVVLDRKYLWSNQQWMPNMGSWFCLAWFDRLTKPSRTSVAGAWILNVFFAFDRKAI
jgi:hypothetical protein